MSSSSKLILQVATSIVVASFLAIGAFSVFAQESGDYIINRVEVWGLFYRLMVVAFTVGAVLMGVFAYVIFRFRESNKKNIPREPLEEQGR